MISLVDYIDRRGLRAEIDAGLGKIATRYSMPGLSALFWNTALDWKVVPLKSKAALGRCYYAPKHIELNEQLLIKGREAEEKSTFLHELAHMIKNIVARDLQARRIYFDNKPHGKLWRPIAIALGDDGGRCADYEFFKEHIQEERAKVGHKHEYKCKDCGYVYKTMRALVRVDMRGHAPCLHKPNRGRLDHKVVR